MKKLVLSVLFLSIFVIPGRCFSNIHSSELQDTLYKANPNYFLQTGLYDVYKTTHAEIVMLGNSITHGANWFELLGRNDVVERGIPSDVLEGYLSRMQYIYKLHPKICFVMGGINDIYSGVPVEKVFESYKKLINELKAHQIIPVIQSTLFVSPKWHNAAERNPEVEKLNLLLKKFAFENSIDFIDLNFIFSDGKFLKSYLTFDGVHLVGKAYELWAPQVERILKKNGL